MAIVALSEAPGWFVAVLGALQWPRAAERFRPLAAQQPWTDEDIEQEQQLHSLGTTVGSLAIALLAMNRILWTHFLT